MMENLNKKAKIQAILDIMDKMDEIELGQLMPKKDESMMMSEEPEKESEIETEIPSKKGFMKIEIEKESPEMEESDMEEEIDPNSSLARLRKRLGK